MQTIEDRKLRPRIIPLVLLIFTTGCGAVKTDIENTAIDKSADSEISIEVTDESEEESVANTDDTEESLQHEKCISEYDSYDELLEDIKNLLDIYENADNNTEKSLFYDKAFQYEWFTSPISWAFRDDSLGDLQVDIDGDGIDELLLGINDSEDDSHNVNVLSMFTIRDGKVDVVFESDYRRSFELYEDGIILDDFGMPNSTYSLKCYKYSAGGTEFIEGVEWEPVFEEHRCQYYYIDSSLQEREISEEEGREFYEELLHRYNKPKFQLHLFKEKQ